MRPVEEIKKAKGLLIVQKGLDGFAGWLYLNGSKGKPAAVVVSWGGGWEHVSVSYSNRCPTWDEMCRVKALFWDDEECVVQYHPPKSLYVNIHPYCLHLWKPIKQEFPTPPVEFVGGVKNI